MSDNGFMDSNHFFLPTSPAPLMTLLAFLGADEVDPPINDGEVESAEENLESPEARRDRGARAFALGPDAFDWSDASPVRVARSPGEPDAPPSSVHAIPEWGRARRTPA